MIQTFKSVIVPMSIPGIMTISIFRFLGLYNDFMGPFIYLADDAKHTIGVIMFYANQIMQYSNNYTALFAAVIIAMMPCLIIYLFFQKNIVEGATMGAVKG